MLGQLFLELLLLCSRAGHLKIFAVSEHRHANCARMIQTRRKLARVMSQRCHGSLTRNIEALCSILRSGSTGEEREPGRRPEDPSAVGRNSRSPRQPEPGCQASPAAAGQLGRKFGFKVDVKDAHRLIPVSPQLAGLPGHAQRRCVRQHDGDFRSGQRRLPTAAIRGAHYILGREHAAWLLLVADDLAVIPTQGGIRETIFLVLAFLLVKKAAERCESDVQHHSSVGTGRGPGKHT